MRTRIMHECRDLTSVWPATIGHLDCIILNDICAAKSRGALGKFEPGGPCIMQKIYYFLPDVLKLFQSRPLWR